ncbi:protein kinase [Microbispora cellulosiformans]|uniref:Protein kinase n=1 Tax=Microbispora cellulosiformans TaxID=2614688 RepID=A0A5J5K650_9ACTN|nr:glycine betaine ABC transporter substrate-binding protein [Microbispora cellulosiformans]KAA9380085.1 protein kinase [Microbispora cellulosiformans]
MTNRSSSALPSLKPLAKSDPSRVGKYRLVGRLGTGGMGVVYAGVDRSGRRAAVKLIHNVLAADEEFRARFTREVAILGRIEGACVARVLGADTAAERPWLATEYIPGPTLEDHIQNHGRITSDWLFGLAAGLAEAIVAIHQAGVVHRDLKPSNVILSPDGPRVVDFGISRALDHTAMTRTGLVIGSPGWISPEEYRGEEAGPAADVYSWALLVAHAATGRLPYGTGRPEVLALKVLNNRVDTSTIPHQLGDLVNTALSKNPFERPTAVDVLDGVVEAWRAYDGETASSGVNPVGEVTARLTRTWVMPDHATATWPAKGSPVVVSAYRHWDIAAVISATALIATVVVSQANNDRAAPARKTAEIGVDAGASSPTTAMTTGKTNGTESSAIPQEGTSKPCAPFTVAVNGWVGSEANAALIEYVAGKYLGCRVVKKYMNEERSWQQLDAGKVDAILENWAHPDLKEKYIHQRKTVVSAGLTGTKGVIGWYVPAWMAAKYPDITNWRNLNKYAPLFRSRKSGNQGQLLEGDPSFISNDRALIKNLKLDYKMVYSGSEAALVEAFRKAEKEKTPLLGWFYEPMWLFAELDLVKINLPAHTAGCDYDPAEVACDYPRYQLDKIVSKKFARSGSPAYTLIKKFTWSNNDQNLVASYIVVDKMTPADAAAKWVETNSDKVKEWLPLNA